ncbi:MAG: VOC family protein [Paracoccaceae bacterium]
MVARLEHANITVPDIDAAIAFLMALEPAFRVRHDSGSQGDYRWVHVGTDDSYVALEEPHEPTPDASMARRYTDFGINHTGWVVDDIEAACARLDAAGYTQGYQSEAHRFRIRKYYLDAAGFEWELVQYLSDRPQERASYD